MNRLLLFATTLLASIFLSCSVGTDPGECEEIECLSMFYRLAIQETRSALSDTAPSSYLVSAAISPSNSSPTGLHFFHLLQFNRYQDSVRSTAGKRGIVLDYRFIGQTDSISVASPGIFNVWKVIIDGVTMIHDSIETPSDPLRITSIANGDTLKTAEDLVLNFTGDRGDNVDTSSVPMVEIVAIDEEALSFHSLGSYAVRSSTLVIPSSRLAVLKGERFQVNILLVQNFIKDIPVGYDDHAQMVYTRTETTYLYTLP